MFRVVLPNSDIFGTVYAMPWAVFTKYLTSYLIFAKKGFHKDRKLLNIH